MGYISVNNESDSNNNSCNSSNSSSSSSKRKASSMQHDHTDFADSDDEAEPWHLTMGDVDIISNQLQGRGGKWTIEEETYSHHLIQLFTQGALDDCKENTSLRVYLADKLDCKPMRITKKYKDSGYDGKLLYTAANVANVEGPCPLHHFTLREKFLRPHMKRSHKKQRTIWVEDCDDVSSLSSCCTSVCNDDSSSEDDLNGQLTPDDLDIMREMLFDDLF